MNIVQQTHSIQTALLVAMSFGLLLAAGSVSATSHYTADDLEEVEATEYTDVDGEWEVELEFTDDSEYEFTLTDIANKDALHEEISETIEDKYDFTFSADDVADMAEYEAEAKNDDDDDDEKDDDDDELEIEAERYEDIDGKWEVEYETDDEEETFYVFDVSDEDDLIEKIADHLDMSVADVEDVIEIDDDEWKDDEDEDEDDDDDDDKETTKDKNKDKDNRGEVISQAAQQQMIQTLLMLIITMLIQGDAGENANIDLSDLLSQLQ